MITDTMFLMTVPNSPEGWERITNLRKSFKDTPIGVVLYGRHSDRKSLSETLFECSDKSRAAKWIHMDLRRRVNLALSETIRVYLKPRPTWKWGKDENGHWEQLPTKWAALTK